MLSVSLVSFKSHQGIIKEISPEDSRWSRSCRGLSYDMASPLFSYEYTVLTDRFSLVLGCEDARVLISTNKQVFFQRGSKRGKSNWVTGVTGWSLKANTFWQCPQAGRHSTVPRTEKWKFSIKEYATIFLSKLFHLIYPSVRSTTGLENSRLNITFRLFFNKQKENKMKHLVHALVCSNFEWFVFWVFFFS